MRRDQTRRNGNSTISRRLDDFWRLSFGLRYTRSLLSPRVVVSSKTGYNGSRLDGGARLEHRWDDYSKVYVFGQGTLNRSDDIYRNDRLGIGEELKVTDKVSATGEASLRYAWPRRPGSHQLHNPTADDHTTIWATSWILTGHSNWTDTTARHGYERHCRRYETAPQRGCRNLFGKQLLA